MKKSFNLLVLAVISMTGYAQQDCETISSSTQYFSVSATAATESDARMNALSLLAENISSVVSSRTDMLTKDDHQTFYNASKSTSVLNLKGISYLTCDKRKKNGVTVLAFISKKDLAQSSEEVAVRVRQYIELMEQKKEKGIDFLPDAYIAYLHTFMSPYAIEYHSDSLHISNVRGYLESLLRTFLSNISVTCSGVTESPDYPDQQLTLSLLLNGTQGTNMKFLVDLPEYGARGSFDHANNTMDVIMTPDGRRTRFSGKLSLVPPPVEADLADISEQIRISRDISFESDMSNIIKLDFNSLEQGEDLVLVPVVRHLAVRLFEWLSEGRLLSTEQRPRISTIGLKELTMRVNGSQELMISKTFVPSNANNNTERRSEATPDGPSINVELIQNYIPSNSPKTTALAPEILNNSSPDDAIVFVHADIPYLFFRSSMSAIVRQVYNYREFRYEILVKPVKQLLFVDAEGLTEKSMGIINPKPKDEIHFQVSTFPTETMISKGLISIVSHPPNASIFINDIETIYRTPFTIMLAEGTMKITLHKKYYHPVDTIIHIDSRNTVDLRMNLVPVPEFSTQNSPMTADPLRYLQGRREGYIYKEMAVDPVQQLAHDNRQEMLSLRRKATVSYSTAILGIMFGAYYSWLDKLISDNSSGRSTLSPMSSASYFIGGVGLVAGIIYSTKLSNLKKKWAIEPAPNARGMGVAVTFRF